jgi:hypothetical protein
MPSLIHVIPPYLKRRAERGQVIVLRTPALLLATLRTKLSTSATPHPPNFQTFSASVRGKLQAG